MGCFQSKERKYAVEPGRMKGALAPDSVEELVRDTCFSIAEVKALQTLFSRVSNSVVQDGLIHKEEFIRALFDDSHQGNLFADRIFYIFDTKKNGVIELGEFVRGLSVFHPKAETTDKIRFAFNIYDKDGSGFISKDEVKDFLFALVSENSQLHFSDEELDSVVEQTFREVDLAKDDKIHPTEWHEFCVKNPAVVQFMTLPVLRDLEARVPTAALQ